MRFKQQSIRVLLLIVTTTVSWAAAQSTLTTGFAGGNGNAGNMFDLTAVSTCVEITQFDLHVSVTSAVDYEIYYKSGSYVGSETTAGDWTLAQSGTVTGAGFGNPTPVTLTTPLLIPASETYGIYITLLTGGFDYSNGNVTVNDGVLQLEAGVGKALPAFWGTFSPRFWNGTVYYSTDSNCGDPGRPVINPDPDMQIRNGDSTDAESILSGTTVNIGSFKRGEIVTLDFLVRNPGAQVLEIGELSLPSFLSNAGEPLPETLDSFASALLTLEVNTSAAGALAGEFSLASNDPDANENPFVFTVTGSVSDTPANVLNILPGVDLGDINAATGEDGVVLLSFKLLVPAGSTSVMVDSLTLAASNAGIERASNLKLYIDGGTRGELDNRDVFVASTDDTEALTFSFPARTFSPDVPMWFIVVGDF